ncbi:MAG: thioredoxin-like protein [Rhodocyclaceae bacterium]|nr:MAG: thioredoxin-like protein [Rhodocyclaceae bacterium]TND04159.1 MAG: thioredoxin-like protein [Rhodocyclaceae bacterium]
MGIGSIVTVACPARTRRAWIATSLLWVLAGPPALAQGTAPNALIETRDLAADARLAAAKGVPLVVLYSRDDCSWCEKLKREHLGPLSRDPAAPALVRELHMDRATALLDFAGRRTTSADFSRQMQARFAPTVMFHGPDGAALADPIVGFRLADFYAAYLERAIQDSQARLQQRKQP